MAIKSSQIVATDLDFDKISDNIKTYLKGQERFKDYDFEGSNLNVIIDMLLIMILLLQIIRILHCHILRHIPVKISPHYRPTPNMLYQNGKFIQNLKLIILNMN